MMKATIFAVDHPSHQVFAFAPGLPSEDAWYAAIKKTCPEGQSCRVTGGDLVEFAYMDRQKQAAMGLSLDGEGLLLGVHVRSPDVWKRITSGDIDTCTVTVDGAGVQIEFPGLQQTVTTTQKSEEKEIRMEESDGSVFVISKSHPQFELIAKCVSAVQSGSLGSLTQASFDQALEAVTKAFAQESGLTHADAAEAVLQTELGGLLYTGLVAAPVAKVEQPIAKAEEEPECCKAINRAAQIILDREPTLTKEQAVSKAVTQNPQLYSDYLRAHGQI